MTMGAGFPVCVQGGTHDNPCRCKVVGPTLGFAAFMVAALVEWPVGALVYCFRHPKGKRIMCHPATVVFPSVYESSRLGWKRETRGNVLAPRVCFLDLNCLVLCYENQKKNLVRGVKENEGMFCVECGTHDNPCRCKVVGPTLGLLMLLITGIVLWPVGAIIFICNKAKGRKIMAKPVNHIYPAVKNAIPI